MVMAEDTALAGLTVLDATELATRCQEIVDQAVRSEDRLVLTGDGRPIAYLERYEPPPRPFYVRPSPQGGGASERVYREVVETIHRSVKVAELQAQSPDLVEQAAANDWRVLIWNRNGPDAMLIRYAWRGRQTSPATAVSDIDWDVGEVWNATLDGPTAGESP